MDMQPTGILLASSSSSSSSSSSCNIIFDKEFRDLVFWDMCTWFMLKLENMLVVNILIHLQIYVLINYVALVLYHDIIPKFIQFLLEDIVINIEVIVLYFIKNMKPKLYIIGHTKYIISIRGFSVLLST